MPLKLGDAVVYISGDDRPLDAAFAGARGKTTAFGNIIQGVLQGVGQRLFDGIVRGAGLLIDKMGQAVVASSNLAESINKTGVVFGSSADEMMAWAEGSATALGMSKRQALDASSGFGALFITMGQGRPVAAEMSQTLVQLASDLSSIYNIPMDQALEKIRAGLAGEIEPLRSVNIFLNDNLVKNKAMAMGLAESTDAVSDAAKVQARYALILEQGAIANGDFANTSREFANGQKILAAEIEDGAARLGNAFRPAAAAIQNTLIDLAPQMFSYAQNITDQFANGLAAGIRAIIPVITTIRQLFTYWFQPGSPPRILPDIDVWGRGTMQAWLDGMASIDVKKAFDTVGRAVEGILRSFVGAGKMDEGALVSTIFGSRDAIAKAVDEFRRMGSVSESTIKRIASSAGPAGAAVSKLVQTYFELQRASEKVKQAQDALNRTTEEYDAIINPLRGALDGVRGQQQALANQQRLIAAQNTLYNVESTAAEKQAAQLEIQQIVLEDQLAAAEQKKDAAIEAGQAAVDTASKEEQAAKLQLESAQATIDRQVETNNLLAEQKRLVEQLAAAQEAAAQKAQAAAEQAANKAEQLAAKAQREAEQLAAAQLRYNMEIADTPGKIALMEAELAKLTPGTADYFDTLTRISQLQEQYKRELEATAKAAAGLGGVDIGPGLDTGVMTPMSELQEEVGAGAKALTDAVGEMAGALTSPEFTAIPDDVKRLADSITGFVDALTELGIRLGLFKDESITASEETKLGVMSNIDELASLMRLASALINGDWSAAWVEFKRIMDDNFSLTGGGLIGYLDGMGERWSAWFVTTAAGIRKFFTDMSTEWGLWFSERSTALGEWFSDLSDSFFDGGANILDSFWDGLKSKWSEIETWFTSSLQGLRNQLPFSEPKDSASPLRGLGKSGESMVNMIQGGMEKASLNVNSLASNLVPATAGATTNNSTSYGPVTVNLTIQGSANDATIGKAKNALMDALRAAGVTT